MAGSTYTNSRNHLDLSAPCDHIEITNSSQQDKVPRVVKQLLASWNTEDCFEHISPVSLPSHEKVIEIVDQAKRILFPGYFTSTKLHASNIEYYIGKQTTDLYDKVSEQITMAIRHDCRRNELPCTKCEERSHKLALNFIESLPRITTLLATDIRAALTGDPATKSPDEVIFCYPGLLATLIFRVAHELYLLNVPIIPRIMTEYAHSLTGIDIHPGATIGEGFFIDHGTGVVIGETTIIGNNVRLYQGVTLGALSLPRDAGQKLRDKKRHPTIEDNVIIYSNTTILGGDTIIGEGSIIGGNIWITESVATNTKVLLKRPELIYSNS
ncbi:serine O-acetyltransferase [Desulforhopalus sp. IMCC35007]|uniref:serine O-acetyltransferase n=1 Tax=Desulforhopalus sp. IMCC35007 TaxID=2569543 RepID=UPI0010AE5D42|nr:serine acetyltransferase [Desulforhopalus sp. IMCC35007]TKB10854.1 serine acetyltransferase [Desulforhopalus sp. IMCC35007]